MNPSVEESKDEARTGAPPPESSAENRQLSWSKVRELERDPGCCPNNNPGHYSLTDKADMFPA